MNKATLTVLLALSVLAISSCKKKSGSVQSIAGTWKFSNIAGTSTNYYDSSNGTTNTYSFAGGDITTTVKYVSNSVPTTTTSSIAVTTETWSFNGDGTYTITEVYDNGGGTPITRTDNGTWYYLSGSKPNDAFIINSGNQDVSLVFDYASIPNTAVYTIQSVGSTLVLTIINSTTTSMGQKTSNNITITFTK